ncbi:MAG: SGNH hydrolase domain-containing protein [Acidimicrobiales bacterium]|nr:SGNH hydrolase domain-containing protein [Acidimicrobiales bacterium]MDG2217480.1 SGNH hydrolase domain-containing protein [Acidimicrobiales bacterium]
MASVGGGVTPVVLEGEQEGDLYALLERTPAQLTGANGWPEIEGPNRDYGDRECGRVETGSEVCHVVDNINGMKVLILGDSTAEMWSPTLETIARSRDWDLYFMWSAGCGWQIGLVDVNRTRTCPDAHAAFVATIDHVQPDVTIVSSLAHTDNRFVRRFESLGAWPELFNSDFNDLNPIEKLDRSVSFSLGYIVEAGSQVVVFEPTPINRFDYPTCLNRPLAECSFPVDRRVLAEETLYRYHASVNSAVASLDLTETICPLADLCMPVVDGKISTIDGIHMTKSYADSLSDELGSRLDGTGYFD